VLTGELRNKIDAVWNAFWSGGISNPLEVIEQITYLLFMRGLDQAQALEDAKVARFGGEPERVIFPAGRDARGMPYAELRWSSFKNREPKLMFTIVSEHVFPFLREMAEDG
jgi:type I restriction enzyme M protein